MGNGETISTLHACVLCAMCSAGEAAPDHKHCCKTSFVAVLFNPLAFSLQMNLPQRLMHTAASGPISTTGVYISPPLCKQGLHLGIPAAHGPTGATRVYRSAAPAVQSPLWASPSRLVPDIRPHSGGSGTSACNVRRACCQSHPSGMAGLLWVDCVALSALQVVAQVPGCGLCSLKYDCMATRCPAGGSASAWDAWVRPLLSKALGAAPLDLLEPWSVAVRYAVNGLAVRGHPELAQVLDLTMEAASGRRRSLEQKKVLRCS